jgi:hypothetical protein
MQAKQIGQKRLAPDFEEAAATLKRPKLDDTQVTAEVDVTDRKTATISMLELLIREFKVQHQMDIECDQQVIFNRETEEK